MVTPIFGRVKGETELALAEMRKANPLFRANTVRPAIVDGRQNTATLPYLPQSAFWNGLISVVKQLFPGRWSPTEPLGRFLAEMAMGRWDAELKGKEFEHVGDFAVVENSGFLKLAGLEKS
jgi:hypothetical protein